jgi:hypothetical protein
MAHSSGRKPSCEDFVPITSFRCTALGADVVAFHGAHLLEGYLIRNRRWRRPAAALVEIDIATRVIDPALVAGARLGQGE